MQDQPIVKASISKQISERLRDAIVSGRFKSGERLPTEDDLAKRYGVSRATVREALKRLAAQNLIRSRRGPAGGNFVNQPTHEELAASLSGAATLLVGMGSLDIKEIVEARRVLQGGCLELAVLRAAEEPLAAVAAALQRQSDPDLSDEAFCAADVAFHRALVNASDNGMLRFVMYSVIEAQVPIINMVVSYTRDRERIIAYHQGLLDALSGGDGDRLKSEFDQLLDYLLERFGAAQRQREEQRD